MGNGFPSEVDSADPWKQELSDINGFAKSISWAVVLSLSSRETSDQSAALRYGIMLQCETPSVGW